MAIPLRVLIVEDVDDDAELLAQELRDKGYDPLFERVDTQKTMLNALERQTWDIVVCDYSMPGFNAVSALELKNKIQRDLPFILVSGTIGEEVAVEAMKAGANDYIMKDNLSRFVPAVQRELAEYKERRHARKSEAQLQKLFCAIECSPGTVIITDIEGRIEYVNPRFSDLTGYAAEEVIGKNPRIWKSGKQSPEIYKELWGAISSGKEWKGEFCNKKKSGDLFWESAAISAVKNEKGVITHYVAVKEDITKRRQMEEAMQALVKGIVGATGRDLFDRIVSSVCEWLETEYAFIGNIEDGKTARALSMRVNGEIISDYVYDLSGAPCENAIKNDYCVYPEGVSRLFPNGKGFMDRKVEGYVGIALKDKESRVIGALWTASGRKLNLPSRMAEVMEIIAAKASAEIERIQAEEQMRASLREKEALLKEIHHRVKNNMQIVSSLLNLQSESVDDENVRQVLGKSQSRVKSMALVHEKLYQTKDLSMIDFGEYTRSLTTRLLHSFGENTNRVQLEIDMNEVFMDVNKAIPCGLIINEIVSNSLKYAFPGGKPSVKNETGDNSSVCAGVSGDKNIIRISMRKIADSGQWNDESKSGISAGTDDGNQKSSARGDADAEIIEFILSDNGIGFPAGYDLRNAKTLGLELVNTLVSQLGGSIECINNGGVEFKITFGM